MLRTCILSLVVSIIYFPGLAQDFSSLSSDLSIHTITSIQSSQDDYADLQFLKDLLKGKRIVLLGEQTHGDGATFEAKVRLIKFLHQQMGFSMVSFESNLYENYKAYQKITSNDYENSPLKESIFSIWSDTKEVEALLQYVHQNQKSSHPLLVSGFDSQPGAYLQDEFLPELKTLTTNLTETDFAVLEQAMAGGIEFVATHTEDSIAFFTTTQKVVKELDRLLKQQQTIQLKIVKQTFMGWLAMVKWEVDVILEKKIAVQNPRDLQMARNLVFLANLYPDKKIIGWGASYHFANQIETYEKSDVTQRFIQRMDSIEKSKTPTHMDSMLLGAVPMGKILKEHFGDQLYSVAFSSYDGSYGLIGRPTQSLIPLEPPVGSIERMLNERGHDYAFVNFNKLNAQEKFYSSALGNLPILAAWDKIFDGLFFIKTSYPPTLALPEGVEPQQTQANKTKLIAPVVYASGKTKKVMDGQTNEPISFATITMLGTSKGVTSNASGEFVFNIPITHLAGYIIVSSIGYESDTLTVKEFTTVTHIKLNPKIYTLEAFEVSAKPLSARDIVKRAEKSIVNNYYQGAHEQEVFYRTSDYVEDSLTFNEEAAILVHDPDGYRVKSDATHKITGKILQFRNSTQNPEDDLWSGVGSLWLMHSHDAILDKSNVLHRSVFYDLKLEGIVDFENKRVYEISFACKRPGAFTTGYGYSAPRSATGKIFIATNTFAVLKFEVQIVRKPTESKRSPGYRADPYGHYLVQQYKEIDGKYFMSYSKQIHYSNWVNVKTNSGSRNVSIRELSSTEINTNPTNKLKLPLTKIKSASTAHDPDFWNAHNTLIEDDIMVLYKALGLQND